jgi:Ca-activated chloride channel family protein
MEQIRTNGEQKELRDEVVDLGTRYGIVTPYTSYLALENEVSTITNITPGAGQPAPSRQVRTLNRAPAPKAADATAVTGALAVQESKRMRDQQQAEKLKEEDSSVIRRAGGKTFYLRNDVWTDAEFSADGRLPETVLTFGSEEFFAILKQKPSLASYFSLGERVIVVFEGRVYRVNAK